ncbi:MAG: dephospho-CoA kinase [Clostridia bacterium]|nr:dephospho-CoA kinase [Clostridia bacterium]
MNKITIGLTGPTGAGKSKAAAVAFELGFRVIDCDFLARVAVEKGSEGLEAIKRAFGNDVINEDGTLNRKELARKAFSSKENTELLNATLLPHIVKLVKEQAAGDRVILDAPTLFESGINNMCSTTVAVLADMETRLERITSRDNISEKDALLRISAGKKDDFYINLAEHIVYNNGDGEEFTRNFKNLLLNIIDKENNNG